MSYALRLQSFAVFKPGGITTAFKLGGISTVFKPGAITKEF